MYPPFHAGRSDPPADAMRAFFGNIREAFLDIYDAMFAAFDTLAGRRP